MDEQEHFRKQPLAKERVFLFLSVVVAAVLLTSSPKSLWVFFQGTFNSFTGASIAIEPVGMKDYFIGLVIFAALVALSFYIVHVLRNPKPQRWQVEAPEEEKEPLKPLAGKYSLENKLDQINHEIQELRKKKEEPPSTRKPRKVTKIPNVKEEMFGDELRKVTARLQGYQKPIILEASSSQGKGKLRQNLEHIQKELAKVGTMKIKKVKIRESTPSMKEIAEALERRRLSQELKKVSSMLEKGRKNSSYFIRRYIPSYRERELNKIEKRLQRKGYLPAKELKGIEKKLMELKKNA